MSIKSDSISNRNEIIKYKLQDTDQTHAKQVIFESNTIPVMSDTVHLSSQKVDANETAKIDKKSNIKKWLVAAGIAVGVIALGVAAYYLTKKISAKDLKQISQNVVGDSAENLAKVKDSSLKVAGDSIEKLSQLDKFDVFKDLKMCKNFSLKEKEELFGILSSKDNKNLFLATISGDKPMTVISKNCYGNDVRRNTLDLLRKLDLGDNIEIVNSISRNKEKHSFWSSFFINKSKVFDIIENNKEIYIKRLNLAENASTQEIYTKFFKSVVKDNNIVMHDLLGISLGYPKLDSMFYQLQETGKLSEFQNFANFPDLLIDFFKSDKNPYKNLSTKALTELEESLLAFKKRYGFASAFIKRDYHDELYDFVNYTQNSNELMRVKLSTENFMHRFYPKPSV